MRAQSDGREAVGLLVVGQLNLISVAFFALFFFLAGAAVGERGLEAMPGPLPPSVAYTYAVELSADEALAAGADREGE